jgi:hypothetical protein
MKILFTGCTSKQTDDLAWQRAKVKRIDDSSIICDSLRKQGYQVDRKEIKPGDDLSKYDLTIVGLAPIGSPNSNRYIIGALYSIYNSKKVLLFYEDWQIKEVIRKFKLMLTNNRFEDRVKNKWSNGDYFYNNVDSEFFDFNKTKETMSNIINGKYDSLIPAFDWGDKNIVRKIIKSKNIYNLDLTPYVLENWNINLKPEPQQKERKYMLASLVDHSSWVKKKQFSWKTVYYGAKSIKDSIKLDTETDVYNECGKYWGILCPEYPHSGSGWFRIRYIYAALQKSIIITSLNDLKALGLSYKHIENLSEEELLEYALQQRKAIFSYSWNKEKFDNRLKEIVNEVYNR